MNSNHKRKETAFDKALNLITIIALFFIVIIAVVVYPISLILEANAQSGHLLIVIILSSFFDNNFGRFYIHDGGGD